MVSLNSIVAKVAIVLVLLVILATILFWQFGREEGVSNVGEVEVREEVEPVPSPLVTNPLLQNAYIKISYELYGQNDNITLTSALETFRAIAIDENSTPTERMLALNGINYAYTQSNFDADTLYEVIFASAPFSTLYDTGLEASTPDPLHPGSGSKVESVERALVELNKQSNDISPNHYAITRMEIASVFAAQRDSVRLGSEAYSVQAQSYARNILNLKEEFDSLPDVTSLDYYSEPMKMQILFAHAGALAFAGRILNDATATAAAETTFQLAIAHGSEFSLTENQDSLRAFNETLLARIFYTSHFWRVYKDSEPERIKEVLRPFMEDERVINTTVYNSYLPSHRNSTVTPATVLREVAEDMPEFKEFLQGRGWTF